MREYKPKQEKKFKKKITKKHNCVSLKHLYLECTHGLITFNSIHQKVEYLTKYLKRGH